MDQASYVSHHDPLHASNQQHLIINQYNNLLVDVIIEDDLCSVLRSEIRTRAEPQQIVGQSPLSCLQYPVR